MDKEKLFVELSNLEVGLCNIYDMINHVADGMGEMDHGMCAAILKGAAALAEMKMQQITDLRADTSLKLAA